MRSDLAEIVSLAIEKVPNLSVISIPSNGLNMRKIVEGVGKILELNNLPRLFLNFSLDGPPKVHNKIRGVEGAYNKTWRTYLTVKDLSQKYSNLRVNLEITISKLNIDCLIEFCTLLINRGEKITMTVAHRGRLYRNEKNKDFFVLHEDLGKVVEVVGLVDKSLSFLVPAELVEKIYLRRMINYLRKPAKQVLPCMALKASCALDSFGLVTPCFMWGKKLGNIRETEGGLLDIWKRQLTQKIRIRIEQNGCPNYWTPCEAYQSIINNFLIGR